MRRIKRDTKKNIKFDLSENNGYSDVNVKPEKRPAGGDMYSYTIYKHTPNRGYASAKARVLYKSQLFEVVKDDQVAQDGNFEVQQKPYEKIETYSYDRSQDLHLLVKFTITEWNYEFFKRVHKNGLKWKQIDSGKGVKLKQRGVSDELKKIEYEISKSIKIQLENSETMGYPVKLIDNSGTETVEPPPGENLKIEVTDKTDSMESNEYICYVHDLDQCSSRKRDLPDVAGLRLYYRRKEIKIYKDDPENNRMYLHYVPGITKDSKLYVYFDASSNKLLLVCYENKAYKAKIKNEPEKLVLESYFSCQFTSGKEIILSKLNEIKELLSPDKNKEQFAECKNQHVSRMAQMPSNGHAHNQDYKCDFWGENKIYIFSGGGAALGAVIIIGFGILLYKKCVKASPAVATDPVL